MAAVSLRQVKMFTITANFGGCNSSIKAKQCYLVNSPSTKQLKMLMFKESIKDVRHLVEPCYTSKQTNL